MNIALQSRAQREDAKRMREGKKKWNRASARDREQQAARNGGWQRIIHRGAISIIRKTLDEELPFQHDTFIGGVLIDQDAVKSDGT